MNKTSERRGFYRALNAAIDLLERAGAFKVCDECDGNGGWESVADCEACGNYGSKGSLILRRLRPENDQKRLSIIAHNCEENFCPNDRKTAWKLAVATEMLQDSEGEAVVAWMFANLAVLLKDDPGLSQSEICLKWSEIFSDTITEIAAEGDDDKPTFGKLPVGEA
jgi:hypothetical protein